MANNNANTILNSRPSITPSLKQSLKPVLLPKLPAKVPITRNSKEIRICLPSINDIYASIYTEIHKRVIDVLSDTLDRLGEDYGINQDELKEKYLKDLKVVLEKNEETKKTAVANAVRKPRTVLATDLRCMARTANGAQCTRRKQKDENGGEYDFCGSHRTNQPNGVVSDPPLVLTEKKKRGRPPKNATSLMDGTFMESNNSNNNEVTEDDSSSMDFFEIRGEDHDYICNKNTNIVYETPTQSQISDISELTRVGIWDPDQNIITYD